MLTRTSFWLCGHQRPYLLQEMVQKCPKKTFSSTSLHSPGYRHEISCLGVSFFLPALLRNLICKPATLSQGWGVPPLPLPVPLLQVGGLQVQWERAPGCTPGSVASRKQLSEIGSSSSYDPSLQTSPPTHTPLFPLGWQQERGVGLFWPLGH